MRRLNIEGENHDRVNCNFCREESLERMRKRKEKEEELR